MKDLSTLRDILLGWCNILMAMTNVTFLLEPIFKVLQTILAGRWKDTAAPLQTVQAHSQHAHAD
jgi:hypothetical protein